MIKAIIFDIGGVVVKGKAEDIYGKLADYLKINRQLFWEFYKKNKHSLHSGEISSEDFALMIKKQFSIRDDDIIQKWKKAYMSIPINNEMLEIIKKLKSENYKTALITNTVTLQAKINKARGLYSIFDVALISSEVGISKPSKELLELVLNRLALRADECIVLDDREEHLTIPKEMGFNVILFQNNQKLIDDFRSLKVKI